MNDPAKPNQTNWNRWGVLAIIALLLFAAWQGARQLGLFDGAETVNQAWFDKYADRFISPATQVTVDGKANKRMFPTAQGTAVVGSYPNGARIKGRWVRGADPKILWFKSGEGYYLWEGNLVGDPAIMAAASQAALDPDKAEASGGPAIIAQSDAASSTASASPAKSAPVADLPSVEATGPAQAFDRRTLALIGQAVGDAALSAEIAGNADLVSPPDSAGGSQLTWSLCAKRCDYDYSSAVIVTADKGRNRVRVCLHDGRRMAGWSEWYEGGRSQGRQPGLCPSRLQAVP